MRLYIMPFAPNVLRVQIFLAEKGLAPELVDISADRQGYRAINPLGQVPALELDDGRIVTESLTICQYVDGLPGGTRLFGDSDDERLAIAMWERRAEAGLFNPGIEYGHHTHPMFAAWMTQFPDYAATLPPKAEAALNVFADQLDRSTHVACERFTVADITAFLGYLMLVGYGAAKPDRASLQRWATQMLARDSMAILRPMAVQFGIRAA